MSADRALIAMSGGVDSSVAAYLMSAAGYDCVGCTMKLHNSETEAGQEPGGHTCCSLRDVEDARTVAYRLGMPYHVFNFSEDFDEKIIQKFIRSYENGVTPNPCIDCNRYMKFDKLFDRAEILDCDLVVTGHYVRVEKQDGKNVLKKAVDETKDQSYVLYSMTQYQLAHVRFPLGELKKSEVREIALKQGFVNAEKPDSQDICFVPDGDYAAVIEKYTGKHYPPGNYVDSLGNIMGQHSGIIHYTIGQRKGLGIAFGSPRFVCDIRPKENEVLLGTNEELFERELIAGDFNWIAGEPPSESFRCRAKIRYRQQEQWAQATVPEDGIVRLVFDEPQRAITPGQAAVLYDGDVVLGGGTILRRAHSLK
ncbi:MAG: tRNA 2-thiouridine(34) synthase MnmA [Clostridiales bacterium]|nr:tRNA 2-thiouridine(34) synthase MnmA [Clostridiales bacterium]